MRLMLLALSLLFTAPSMAENFWIPADDFDQHSDARVPGALTVDDATGKQIQLLSNNQQVRIRIGLDSQLRQYLNNNPVVQACVYVANYDSGVTNTVLVKHFDSDSSRDFTVSSRRYQVLCSKRTAVDQGDSLSAGLQVVSPSEGALKVRGVFFRSIERSSTTRSVKDYEYSRALGYLWGDGSTSSDGNFLVYPRTDSSTSRHYGSVAEAYFGSALSVNSTGSRYSLRVDGIRPGEFLLRGMPLSDIPDMPAFLTSVIETEGAVLVGRVADDANLSRCVFIKSLVDDLNPRCSTNTCTDASCNVPNCAFIANNSKRGIPHRPGSSCAVYLSGKSSDWKELFQDESYHFVKTDRTPGGEPTKHSPNSRPSNTQSDPTPTPNPVANPRTGYVFSRTDKNEFRWIAARNNGVVGNIWISQSCAQQLGGPTEFGDWNDLTTIAPAHDSIANPCNTSSDAGYVFSRTDKSELRWIAPTRAGGVTGNIWIDQQCANSLGGPTVYGDWNELLAIAPAVDAIAYPCN